MNIISTQYTLQHKSLEIYLSGCKPPHCKHCSNPDTWCFSQGTNWSQFKDQIQKRCTEDHNMIENIMIFGGEPLDQDLNELSNLLTFLRAFNKKIWVFTKYDISEVPEGILKLCDYIKTGRYLEDQKSDNNIQCGIKLATSNQKIIKV